MMIPGRDVLREARARFHPVPYLSDWTSGLALGPGILAPAAHVFFLSLFPALAFSAQMEAGTGGAVAGVQVLMSTAIFGLVQAVLGAESLLIVGVAEPLVLIYTFLYRFAIEQSPTLLASAGSGYSPAELFLPWVGFVCVFSGVGCVLLACLGAASYTASFSRFAGESFGAVVAGLFFQQAVKISVAQFRLGALYSDGDAAELARSSSSDSKAAVASLYALANGVFSLFIACGLVVTALLLRRARAASIGNPKLRGLVADFGAVIATVLWTVVSFATAGFSPTTATSSSAASPPPRIPARLAAVENAWESAAFWGTAARMRAVPPRAVAAALLPAAVVAVLFFFDHGISALMARDVLRDRGGTGCDGEGGKAAGNAAVTEEAGAADVEEEEEERALEAGGRATKAATEAGATAAGAASPGKASAANSKLKPSAYAYDLFLCGISMVAAGIMGLPPTNGVLPQAPMHTHALSVAAGERARRIAAAAEVEERQAEAEAEAAVSGAAAAAENGGGGFGLQQRRRKKSPMATSASAAATSTTAAALPAAPLPHHRHSHHHPLEPATSTTAAALPAAPLPHHRHSHHQPLEPLETRLASLLQYLAILACAFAGPVMRLIPRGAIAGYFAFMSFEWVFDSEMVDRLRWLCSDAAGRASVRRPVAAFSAAVPEGASASSSPASSAAAAATAAAPPPLPPRPPPPARWTRAPTKSIAAFTAFQLACVASVYALTWVPVAGILFPVPIMLFVPLRTHVLPRVFGRAQIELLDGP